MNAVTPDYICKRPRPRRRALGGNPIEYGNIRVIESGGQTRHGALGLSDHDLRMRDHGGERFDRGVVTTRLYRATFPAWSNCSTRLRFHAALPY